MRSRSFSSSIGECTLVPVIERVESGARFVVHTADNAGLGKRQVQLHLDINRVAWASCGHRPQYATQQTVQFWRPTGSHRPTTDIALTVWDRWFTNPSDRAARGRVDGQEGPPRASFAMRCSKAQSFLLLDGGVGLGRQ